MKAAWTRVSIILTFLLTTFHASIAQTSDSLANLLVQFDQEHDLAAKERLLRGLIETHPTAGPQLLKLAESTSNIDTRWMAMRGIAMLHYTAAASFLEESLKHPDPSVRGHAARALGELRITSAAEPLLAMFAAEKYEPAIQQASLALRLLDIRAAAPYVREKIPSFTGQTLAWLIQSLGFLGDATTDVPAIAGYLSNPNVDLFATYAIEDLTGVSFGVVRDGEGKFPRRPTIAAQVWWQSHKDTWPKCDDCRSK